MSRHLWRGRAGDAPDRALGDAPDTPADRGSMSVELVVIAPALVLLLLLLGAGGRWVESHGALDGAARDAARAASLGRTAGDADTLANQAADADLSSSGWCDGGTVSVGVSGFPATATVAEGTVVTVTVNCSVDMSPFTELGFKAATPVTSTAVAPLDPFMCRGADCQ
jgi:Flp pilus assembly protein TadG